MKIAVDSHLLSYFSDMETGTDFLSAEKDKKRVRESRPVVEEFLNSVRDTKKVLYLPIYALLEWTIILIRNGVGKDVVYRYVMNIGDHLSMIDLIYPEMDMPSSSPFGSGVEGLCSDLLDEFVRMATSNLCGDDKKSPKGIHTGDAILLFIAEANDMDIFVTFDPGLNELGTFGRIKIFEPKEVLDEIRRDRL